MDEHSWGCVGTELAPPQPSECVHLTEGEKCKGEGQGGLGTPEGWCGQGPAGLPTGLLPHAGLWFSPINVTAGPAGVISLLVLWGTAQGLQERKSYKHRAEPGRITTTLPSAQACPAPPSMAARPACLHRSLPASPHGAADTRCINNLLWRQIKVTRH